VSRIFFTDRDLGKQFPAILSSAGFEVERHADLFAPDGSDEIRAPEAPIEPLGPAPH
jgi:hypothetical protein